MSFHTLFTKKLIFHINNYYYVFIRARYASHTMFDDSGFPIYKRRKTQNTVSTRNAVLDNQWVVPYNRNLLVRYQSHINLEVCNDGRCMKYLFKYCLKGNDRATMLVKGKKSSNESENGQTIPRDEIQYYLDGRYV